MQCRFRGREVCGEESASRWDVLRSAPLSCAAGGRRGPRTRPQDHRVAGSLGIGSPETLRKWARHAEADRGLREAPTSEELAEIKRLRKEVADQQRTIEILKAVTALFLKEADPQWP